MDLHKKNRSKKLIFGIWEKEVFSSWDRLIQSSVADAALFVLGCFVVTFLLLFQLDTLPNNIQINSYAPNNIKADQNYEIVDIQTTQEHRKEAEKSILAVYDYDEALGQEIDQRIRDAFDQVRNYLQQYPQAGDEELIGTFKEVSGLEIEEEDSRFLLKSRFNYQIERWLRNTVQIAMSTPIIEDMAALDLRRHEGAITLRRVRMTSQENEKVEKNLKLIRSLSEVREDLEERVRNSDRSDRIPETVKAPLISLSGLFLRANTNFNVLETEKRKEKAISGVKPDIIKIQNGEMIIRNGDPYTRRHLIILQGIQKQRSLTNKTIKFAGTFLFVALLILVTYSFASRYIRKFKPTRTDLIFLGTNLIIILLFARLFSAVSSVFKDSLSFEIEMQALYYMIPVSAGAMIVRLILNSEIAIIFAVIASALAGLFLKTDIDLSIFFIISSIAGAGSIAYADRRSAILKAGIFTGLINVVTIFTIKMIQVFSVAQQWSTSDILFTLFSGFLGGTNSALYILFYTPIAEMLFGYTTDMKLLELGNLNHPLLKEMIVKAPGTYHHSQLVAVLSEAASEAIGANPIVARVGSYFHDVGKMVKPLYFIENQMGGQNRHDALSPSMSALIIASHVKDGIELAEKHKLPKIISDMIPQHQGTKIISFFYNKAKEMEKAGLTQVREEDYRYPGPRPQTREAGILLLADGVEAAVRSLPEKNPNKIQSMVQKMINRSFSEEQLEECELTLRDLRTITDCFVRVLIGIYHQRIEYPDQESKNTVSVPKKLEIVSHSKPITSLSNPQSSSEHDFKEPAKKISLTPDDPSEKSAAYPSGTRHP